MQKTICIITSINLNEPVIQNRLFTFFDIFIQKGLNIQCVCPKSSFKKEKLPKGVILEEVDIKSKKTNNFIKRAFQEATEAFLLLKHSKKLKNDTILITIPSMFLAFIAPFYLKKSKTLLDVRDLSWEYLSETSLIQKLAKKIFRLTFKYTSSFYKIISTTNDTEIEYIKNLNKNINPLHISNGIRLKQFECLQKVTPSQEEKFTITYIGNIGIAQNLSTLIETARLLPHFSFKIVGSGIEELKIKELIYKYNLKNIDLPGKVDWDQLINYYNSSHVLYAQLSPNFSGAMPSKLYEYIATGKSIVYGGQGQAEKTLSRFENCEIIEPCNPYLLAQKLEQMSKSINTSYLSNKNKIIIENNYIRETSAIKLAEKIISIN